MLHGTWRRHPEETCEVQAHSSGGGGTPRLDLQKPTAASASPALQSANAMRSGPPPFANGKNRTSEPSQSASIKSLRRRRGGMPPLLVAVVLG